MKKLLNSFSLPATIGVIAICSLFSLNANAKYIPNESSLIKVCKAIQTNNAAKLRVAVKRSGYSYRDLAKGLMCNGQTVVEYAMSHGAIENANLMAKLSHTKLPQLVAQTTK